MSGYKIFLVSLTLGCVSSVALSAQSTDNSRLKNDATIIFSAPPRENSTAGEAKYGPVADYLAKLLNKKVVYKHPGTWGAYRTKMLQGKYDILFDGPHFNSYRVENLKHNVLVKIPDRSEFVVIIKKGRNRFSDIHQLAGRTFCAHAPPNLGTLTLLSQFPNPSHQPAIINTRGWKNIFNGVQSGKCTAGILPIHNLRIYDASSTETHIVWKNRTLPNQAFSAGPRLSSREQKIIASALVSRNSRIATSRLRAAYQVGKSFVSATNQEYLGISEYLKNEWGFY